CHRKGVDRLRRLRRPRDLLHRPPGPHPRQARRRRHRRRLPHEGGVAARGAILIRAPALPAESCSALGVQEPVLRSEMPPPLRAPEMKLSPYPNITSAPWSLRIRDTTRPTAIASPSVILPSRIRRCPTRRAMPLATPSQVSVHLPSSART